MILKKFDLKHFIFGILLGAAGTMPGLSGGSVAFILGIYERLIDALAKLNPQILFPLIKKRAWKDIINETDSLFSAMILLGSVCGIFIFSFFMPYLMQHYTHHMNALFLGLMAASIPHIFKNYDQNPRMSDWALIIGVAILTYFLSGIRTEFSSDGPLFLFFSGALALIAMLLPGISGSFILLMLGNYHYIFAQINKIFFFDINALLNVFPFILGALSGSIFFVGAIKYCLHHFRSTTLALLIGLMLGSLPSLWPFTNADNTQIFMPHFFGLSEVFMIISLFFGLLISFVSLRIMNK
ncbi:MAG: DUF368 domain-containing protein [Myxococcales bacterium]|nr:DUF368 domain-containing protein [Myxococcales bacterium]USN50347.1 MAG: DUF368 domain-containing protein [Myxococcales bacterium]